jgi:tripartite-type tricarboxylate transporter receptor subunit TctC
MVTRILLAVALLASFSSFPARAEPISQFYAGKTVKIIIGASSGGEYGLYAQLIARHIGKFIPGKPTVIVQSIPGAGGMTALRYAANSAPRDGTVISLPHVIIFQDGLLNPAARFDPAAFQWIGRLATQLQVGIVSSHSNVRSLTDAKHVQLTAGGTAANNPTALNARILNALAGTRFKIVTGYKGTHEVAIAWERGEIDVLTTSWDLITSRYADKLKAGLAMPLYANAAKRPLELSNIPLMTDFGRTEGEKAFLQIYALGAEIGRSLAAPPGVPSERVNAWRDALQRMIRDPDFNAEIKRSRMRLEPSSGDELTAQTAKVTALPQQTIIQARDFYDRLLAETR